MQAKGDAKWFNRVVLPRVKGKGIFLPNNKNKFKVYSTMTKLVTKKKLVDLKGSVFLAEQYVAELKELKREKEKRLRDWVFIFMFSSNISNDKVLDSLIY